MKIDRSELLAAMISFFQQDSGVVIGNPGVGKTYVLSEIVTELLVKQGIPCTMISFNYLTDGKDADINASLGIHGEDWLEALKKIKITQPNKGLLIFDGFDIIKDEALKKTVLTQIDKAKRELKDWTIVVSVRTYDAVRSQKLLDIFPAEQHHNGIHCRHFEIPLLNETEMTRFLAGNAQLNNVYQAGSDKLKSVLQTPFFLSLLEIIIAKTGTSAGELSGLQSETELLEMYWNKVVDNIQPSLLTNLLLKNLTQEMVDTKVLSVNKFEFLGKLDTPKILVADELLRENVFAEQGTVVAKIAFSHNILFDYAVAKLILKDSASEILVFIDADKSRPFFLRPSLIYFFARLWYKDQTLFWAIYNELSASSDEVILLFNKLIPASVIAREFSDISELRFLDPASKYRTAQIQNTLQALRFAGYGKNKAALLSALEILSGTLQIDFVGDFTLLLEQLTDDAEVKSSTALYAVCGKCSRNLWDFLYANRTSGNIDQFAAYHGTELVGKTFATGPHESRIRLTQVLNMLDEPDFNMRYIISLTNCVKDIYLSDPDFASKIYTHVHQHREDSGEPIPIHQGALMSFSSSRHDQYSTCKHMLKEVFPKFLRAFPDQATQTGLAVARTYIGPKCDDGILIDTIHLPAEFQIDGINAHYQVDMSHFWAESSLIFGTETFYTETIIGYFEELVNQNDKSKLEAGLRSYFQYANYAFNWNKLLKLGAKYPKAFSELLFPLLKQPSVLYWNDTMVEAVNFLGAAASYYSDEQIHEIEQAILRIPDYLSDSERAKLPALFERLFSRIPKEKLRDDRAIQFAKDQENVKNDPLVSYTFSSEAMTTSMYLGEEGVDVQTPVNKGLIAISDRLQGFSHQFRNGIPDKATLQEPLREAISLYQNILDDIDGTIHPRLREAILTTITDVSTIALKANYVLKGQEVLTNNDYVNLKAILLLSLETQTDGDAFAEQNSSPGHGWSPTPRIEAAEGLPYLFAAKSEDDVFDLIEQFYQDKNPVVRYNVQKAFYLLYPDKKDIFWKLVHSGVSPESDHFAKGNLLRILEDSRIYDNDSGELLKVLKSIQPAVTKIQGDQHSTLTEAFFELSTAYYRYSGDQQVQKLLMNVFQNNIGLASTMIFKAFEIIEPENYYRNYSHSEDVAKSKRLIELFDMLLTDCHEVLKKRGTADENEDEIKGAFRTIDTLIQRIYFSMQINDRLPQKGPRITKEDREIFYFFCKPLLEKILEISRKLDSGFMQGHSAHYFIEIMQTALRFDPEFALSVTSEVTRMSWATGYTFDPSAISRVVEFTQILLADHKDMLTHPPAFKQIMDLLAIYVKSGWPQALDLLWKLDEVFR